MLNERRRVSNSALAPNSAVRRTSDQARQNEEILTATNQPLRSILAGGERPLTANVPLKARDSTGDGVRASTASIGRSVEFCDEVQVIEAPAAVPLVSLARSRSGNVDDSRRRSSARPSTASRSRSIIKNSGSQQHDSAINNSDSSQQQDAAKQSRPIIEVRPATANTDDASDAIQKHDDLNDIGDSFIDISIEDENIGVSAESGTAI